MKTLLIVLLVLSPALALGGDTLVVASPEYRDALGDWLEHRKGQGRAIEVVVPPANVEGLQSLLRDKAKGGKLEYVVLVGDAPVRFRNGKLKPTSTTVPMGYTKSSVNVMYGAAPHIATDNLLADLDGDASPELRVGRIPCHSQVELKSYMARVIAFENALQPEPAPRVTVVASSGRFSPFLDSVIEMTAQQVLRQLIPQHCDVHALHTTPTSEFYPKTPFRQAVMEGLRKKGLAWVYMGHGSRQGLDRLVNEPGRPRLLTHADLKGLEQAGPRPTIAALMACHTGCVDGDRECLAERMVMCPGGPLAVIASSRICMPYGNSVLGIEMLNCLFTEKRDCIGDVVCEGKRRALRDDSPIPLRASVQQIGAGASPSPKLLREEVVEHVHMYNLLGDPLLRVQ